MPAFRFKAFDADGRPQSGTLEAASRETALASMHHRGLYPTEVAEAGTAQHSPWWSIELTGRRTLPASELAVFTRELATLLNPALPVDEALRIISLQPLLARGVRTTVASLLEQVSQGAALHEAFARCGRFPEFYWQLVQAGEMSGEQARVLSDLAQHLEHTEEIRQKLHSGLAYPLFLLVAALASAFSVAAVLLPAIAPIFDEAGRAPPWAIGFLLWGQRSLSDNWPLLLTAIAAMALALMALMRQPAMRISIQRILLKVPVVGRIIRHGAIARFSRTLSIMLEARVPMLDAISASARALGNPLYEKALLDVSERVSVGEGLSSALSETDVFTELALRLVSVGERTAKLEVMLGRVADIYEGSVQRDLSRITTMAAPVITLLIGVLVGGLMLSVIQALLSINELALK